MADQNLKIQLTAIDKTRRAFASVAGGLRRVGGSIANVKTALVGLAAAAGLREFATQIDDLAKASSRLGLTVNQIQSLQFAASQTGASSQELEKGLTRFSRAISEASTGIGTGMRAFEALGITLTDQAGNLRPTNDLLNEVSDALVQIESPADRVRIAFDLFGRSGVNLVNTLQSGSGELGKLRQEFNAVTIQLTQEDAAAVEKANDLFDKLGRVFSSIGQKITSVVLPALAKVAQFFTVLILKAVSGSTMALREFLNFFIDVSNEVANTNLARFTFGKELEAEIARIVFNLENFGQGVEMTKEGLAKVKVGADQSAGSVKGLREEVEILHDAFGDLNVDVGDFSLNTKLSKTALEEYEDAAHDVRSSLDQLAVRGLQKIEDSFAGLVTGTMTAKEAFRSMAQSIVADLAKIAARRALANVAGSFAGFFTPGKAIGGPVQRGQPYVVGERGPEMFVPNQSGSIIPNGQTGGGSVTINQTVNLSTGVSQTVRAEVMNMLPQIQQAAVSGVLDAKRRGGSFGSAFGT